MPTEGAKYYLNVHQHLIDLCYEHNQNAQRKVYRLYYKAMYNTAYRIINDRHSAEDVMQEAFLKAFKKIHLYNNSNSFGVWLKRIVINESINFLSKHKNMFYTDEQFIFESALNQENSSVDVLWNDGDIKRIQFAMQQLTDRYRIIISLILLEGYDLEEASEIMNITYGNARVLYMRAKNKLKTLVKKNHEQ